MYTHFLANLSLDLDEICYAAIAFGLLIQRSNRWIDVGSRVGPAGPPAVVRPSVLRGKNFKVGYLVLNCGENIVIPESVSRAQRCGWGLMNKKFKKVSLSKHVQFEAMTWNNGPAVLHFRLAIVALRFQLFWDVLKVGLVSAAPSVPRQGTRV